MYDLYLLSFFFGGDGGAFVEGGSGAFCGEVAGAGAFGRQVSAWHSPNWEPADVTVSERLKEGYWGQ